MRIVLFIGICLIIAACQPEQTSSQTLLISNQAGNTTENSAFASDLNTAIEAEQTVSFAKNDITLQIKKPAKWESFPTEYGIVIGESFGSVATAGVLKGLMTYAFVAPMTDFILPAGSDSNIAQAILNQILADPTYTASIAYQPAVGFRWDDYDAAYYLLSGEDGNATIVLGAAVPELKMLLSCSVSAPYDQRDRIRHLLPTLLDGVILNNVTFRGDDLNRLPDPLVFPDYHPALTVPDRQ